jgi:FtsP/CotA-like multicopper oxidase with cupredoxin domain
MTRARLSQLFVSVIVLLSILVGSTHLAVAAPNAMPDGPTDETKVPHYFGPYPNWANSPYRLPDVAVTLSGGGGSGATAAAEVDPQSGALTGITVLTPGSGFTSAPSVSISGAGVDAAATAVVDYSGIVSGVNVTAGGSGYSAPTVAFSGGGASTDATGVAYGGVDAVVVTVPGDAYTFPTVEFGLPQDPAGVPATGHADMDANGAITAVVVDNPGSGYSSAPTVTIHNGTPSDPIAGNTPAEASATLAIQSVALTDFGSGYTSAPSVTFSDSTGGGASAEATITTSGGAVTEIVVTNPGSGYMTPGIKKFTDELPGLCVPGSCPDTGKYIPVGYPQAKLYNGIEADEYVIALVQYRTSFSSSLPDTLVRGYVQVETPDNAAVSQHFPLVNEMLDGSTQPVFINGQPAYGVTAPQWLGPTLLATKDRPVRIVFYNLLPTNAGGDLFLPVDSSMMGSGMGPMGMDMAMDEGSVMDEVRNPLCSESPKPDMCFKDNRATLHLHGGITPWISDGTPHQWITPAGEMTDWPQGVSVENVPDMDVCTAPDDGCMTFYYTNQQSARLMFYHDHAWGITRLNVYAGEAAGYLISDETEQALLAAKLIPADQIPLIVQDRTFVPDAQQLAAQDPTWDTARWGGYGNFWYHHVYMPAQNPDDLSGMSAYGRWMYGPWFWPPAINTIYGPIDNPYFDENCNIDDPDTWQYQTDPFCEPQQIPGTPNVSVGMEQFNDTPVVNGVAYPTVTLLPRAYRFRVLNAANDRFFNFQWYVGDSTTANPDLNSLGEPIGATEVAFKAAELAAAQEDPNVFPTPDTAVSLPGPDWVQIGTEGGFLPAPVVIDGQQVTTWITDPTRFDVGNVDKHSLLLAPAERADVIVDFSAYAGQTLILYNDAPAAFPARVPSYDYYTGAPDLSPTGAPTIVPGYGPNTRTVMQVKIAAADPEPPQAFNLAALQTAFRATSLGGGGVFQNGQHPIIVGQAAYNSAYGTNFPTSANCNVTGSRLNRCDGYVRVNNTATFSFNTLLTGTTSKLTMPLQPKAIHDEMNSATFDEFGRMTANLGVEASPPSPAAQNVTLYPYVNPATELIDATNLPVGDVNVTPIASASDGSQIWRITHNGVDTHPIHFHLYDVQLINRVTWDNIIIPPDANELGWKDTVRVAPLEDTIVALRPIVPQLPFEIPNAIRDLNPMMPTGSQAMFQNIDVNGNPTAPIVNQLVNFGWEYVYHCHILSHEEMDMMRPVSLAVPPFKPDGLTSAVTGTGNNRRLVLSWNDNSITETAFVVQSINSTGNWVDVASVQSPLNQPNIHQARSLTLPGVYNPLVGARYRIVAQNTVGYGSGFPALTVQSTSDPLAVNLPAAPTAAVATLLAGPQIRLTWTDNAVSETGFVIERSSNGVTFTQIGTAPARNNTGAASYIDVAVPTGAADASFTYRVAAVNLAGQSAYAVSNAALVPGVPAAPTNFVAVNGPNSNNQRSVVLTWTDNASNETGYILQRATNAAFSQNLNSVALRANIVTYTATGLSRNTAYYFRLRAANGTIIYSAYVNAAPFPITTLP